MTGSTGSTGNTDNTDNTGNTARHQMANCGTPGVLAGKNDVYDGAEIAIFFVRICQYNQYHVGICQYSGYFILFCRAQRGVFFGIFWHFWAFLGVFWRFLAFFWRLNVILPGFVNIVNIWGDLSI